MHVVIVGGGFAGLAVAQGLERRLAAGEAAVEDGNFRLARRTELAVHVADGFTHRPPFPRCTCPVIIASPQPGIAQFAAPCTK